MRGDIELMGGSPPWENPGIMDLLIRSISEGSYCIDNTTKGFKDLRLASVEFHKTMPQVYVIARIF